MLWSDKRAKFCEVSAHLYNNTVHWVHFNMNYGSLLSFAYSDVNQAPGTWVSKSYLIAGNDPG